MSSITSAAASNSRAQQAGVDLSGLAEHALTLFVTQLRYQDPTEPMQASDMMQSLATISNAGQTVQMNNNLESIIGLLGGGSQFGTPVSYLGRVIEYDSPDFILSEGSSQFYYELEEQPEEVFITVYDRAGTPVFSTDGSDAVGKNRILWDGTDQNGNQLEDGLYSVSVTAVFEEGELPRSIPTSVLGTVTQATFQDDEVVLMVNDIIVRQEQIRSVFPPPNTQQASNDTGG